MSSNDNKKQIPQNPSPPIDPVRPYIWSNWVLALIPALLTFLVYLPSLPNQFTNWDDIMYIQENSHIRHFDVSSIKWMFTHFYSAGLWIPLTWISLALDYLIGKMDPRIYHLDNLCLHCLNTIMVFFLSIRILKLAVKDSGMEEGRKKTWLGMSAFLTALLFGMHPIHVESVAWATERKDLLYGFFFLASLIVYLDYASAPVLNTRKLYACLGLFIISIFSKPMAVTLPLVLILLDIWPLGRMCAQGSKVFLEKIPFFIGALASGVVAIFSQSSTGSFSGLNLIPLSYRFMNSTHSLVFYLQKMVCPTGLAALYPIDLKKTFSPPYVYSAMAAILITSICFIYRKKRPYWLAAWVYYLVTLAPVLGILQVGSQSAADRFTYLPSLGPTLLFGAAVAAFFNQRRAVFLALTVGLAAWLGYGTYRQTETWKDTVTLWENVLRVNPRNSQIAHANLADGFLKMGRLDEALREFDKGIAIGPLSAFSFDGKGMTLLEMGRLEEALQNLKEGVSLEPENAKFHCHLGTAYEKMGKYQEALGEILEGIRRDPDYSDGYFDLGVLYMKMGDQGKSVEAYKKALALDPDNSEIKAGLADVSVGK